MELRHMRYFIAVAEHLHFGRAAEALATAQPSLSRQILQLEDELGVKLFERTNRHVELTGAGRLFLTDARRTIDAADASIRHARENAGGTRGELRIGFIGGAMMMLLPVVLREYRRRYPNVDVIPHAMHYPEHVPALHADTLDIAWTIHTPDPDITSVTVATDPLLAVVPSDHPLAARERVEVGDFSGEGLVVLSRVESPMLYDYTLGLCASSGFRPAHIHEAYEEETVLGLVAAGFGVAMVPLPWSVIAISGIAFRDLAVEDFVRESLSWHRDRETPVIRAFVATALEILAEQPQYPSRRASLGSAAIG